MSRPMPQKSQRKRQSLFITWVGSLFLIYSITRLLQLIPLVLYALRVRWIASPLRGAALYQQVRFAAFIPLCLLSIHLLGLLGSAALLRRRQWGLTLTVCFLWSSLWLSIVSSYWTHPSSSGFTGWHSLALPSAWALHLWLIMMLLARRGEFQRPRGLSPELLTILLNGVAT
jgi:hypothetical protein